MSKIDVHHHVYPPALTEAIKNQGGDPSGWYVPRWTVEADLAITSAIGVKIAVLSVTAPGPCVETDPTKAATLARQCNDYTAKLRRDYPSRFGFFASLPSIQDTEASLAEIAYAFDTLGADGVTLYTRYGAGNQYLGNEAFRPIWAELNRRKAVVFVHPTHGADSTMVNPHLPLPMFDYPHETGRAAMDMLTSGTLRDYPDCKIILSHAGGTMLWLIHRAAGALPFTPFTTGLSMEEILEDARSFYFDTAISADPVILKGLFEFAKPGHILFGSDFPNAPEQAIKKCTEVLEKYDMSPETLKAIQYESALALLPRLASQF